ncbi:Hypothetical predicted protein, partial [Mytilus galloprovincialis]
AALTTGIVIAVSVTMIIIFFKRRIIKQGKNDKIRRKQEFSRKIQNMTSSELNIYTEAMNSGKEVRRYVRIQVVGKNGVGKTSLVCRLLGEKNIQNVTSTDGIDVTVKKCQIRTKDGKWIVGKGKFI